MPNAIANTRQNYLRLPLTLSWLMALWQLRRSYKRRTICRSCSRTCLIPWVRVSSRACRGQGGNVTGFTYAEFGQSAKWLELLKEIAPRVTRVAVLLNRGVAGSMARIGAIQGVAPSFGVEVSSIDFRDVGEVEHAITAFARAPNGGLILTGTGSGARRELIITLAARHRLPAVYPFPFHVTSGGLTSYGPAVTDNYRLAAGYVDRNRPSSTGPDEIPARDQSQDRAGARS
jgi:ABC transporter substrate binding protein